MTHREIIARALCVADERAPDPDAPIYIKMRAAKAWEARLPDADRFLSDLDKRGLCITEGWRDIATYPKEHVNPPDVYWGPEVVVLVPACPEYPYDSTRYVAHLEADEWLVRDDMDPVCWSPLFRAPTHWMPLPDESK